MKREILIDPVTRIEGHAKITIYLDDAGEVNDARFHVTELRGFEKFCEGRTLWEMPALTARICGICPVSHILASAKTGDAILSVRIPKAAELLRRLMNAAQFVQSHALSFFYLSAPDMLLGWDSDPAQRNVIGLIGANPDLARKGIRLRSFGQQIIERLGGKKIHPAWAVPGGVNRALSKEDADFIKANLPEALDTIRITLDLFKSSFADQETRGMLSDFPSLFMGLVSSDGAWEHYDGNIRIVDSHGKIVVDQFDPAQYPEIVQEASEGWSYLKFPHYAPLGYPEGMYRVGPLGRVNVCDRFGTPLADAELEEFRAGTQERSGRVFDYHYTRLMEILASLERMERLINDERILSPRIRAEAGINELEGVGIHEAPRGTLFHHYKVDANGVIQWVNLIVSTGQNNLAMNRSIKEIAQQHIHSGEFDEGILNRIEGGIRAFDPCLSCSVHAVGQMPLLVELQTPDGKTVDRLIRD
ncbi:MAG TPA: Ni/Fe hydrogenase subunit alpha [Candidatus Acetothermia bacterium]|nr:Ni/Fe hydrogenase subunit alpha [Candidatus Acetothermia bacterium]